MPGPIVDQVVVNCRHIVCHIEFRYGQEKLLPDNSMSRMRVSIGVLPTSRTKNNCSITCNWRLKENFALVHFVGEKSKSIEFYSLSVQEERVETLGKSVLFLKFSTSTKCFSYC